MLIAIAVVCTLCEAIFTALEVALSATSRARLRTLLESERLAAPAAENGEPPPARSAVSQRAARALRVLEQPERTTILFITITSLSLWAAASLLTWQALAEDWPSWTLPLAIVAILFVAEVLPLLIAARNPEGIALRGSGLVSGSLLVLAPVLWLVDNLARGVARIWGAGARFTPQVTESELRTALATAEEEGVIESEERAMLEGAMDLREKQVREVMTPRIDIIGAPADATLPEVLRLAMREGHSRLPIYEGTLDKIIGILAAKDLIPHLRHGGWAGAREDASNGTGEAAVAVASQCARDVARPAFFVHENKRIASTLEDLRRQRTLMAIVVDADGGTAGLVTLEDLLEEIVGEIQDEYDEEEPAMRIVEPCPPATAALNAPPGAANGAHAEGASQRSDAAMLQAVVCEAGVAVRDFERFWRRSFGQSVSLRDTNGAEADASSSMAALALNLFDGVPQPGDRVPAGVVLSDGTPDPMLRLELEVMAMDGPRIQELKVRRVAAETAGD